MQLFLWLRQLFDHCGFDFAPSFMFTFTIVSSVYQLGTLSERTSSVWRTGKGLGVNVRLLRFNKKKKKIFENKNAACLVTKHELYVVSHF